ncbi:dienelactone hydrolase family protein [Thermodesulfobacteriota bacterium]
MKTRVYYTIAIFIFIMTFSSCASTIKLTLESGKTIKAFYGSIDSNGKHPAIIYNHGTVVRKLGYSETAKRGYDVKDFVNALNEEGFIVIAPIRKTGRLTLRRGQKPNVMNLSSSEWNNAVSEGIEAVDAALYFLNNQPSVDSKKIGIVGFSEGAI